MTLPTLIQKQQKNIAAKQLKIIYTKLYNAIEMAEAEHGEAQYWQYFNENLTTSDNSWIFTNTYIAPYFKKVNLYRDGKLHGCKNVTYRTLDGEVKECSGVWGFCETCGSAGMGNMTQLHLIDGTIIIPLVRRTGSEELGYNTQQVEIDVDTNGYKGPNVWGKDVFRLFLSSYTDYKLLGAESNKSRISNLNACKTNIYKNIYGCAAVIMADGWEIKDDYPW